MGSLAIVLIYVRYMEKEECKKKIVILDRTILEQL
jgi:hypothetical protein